MLKYNILFAEMSDFILKCRIKLKSIQSCNYTKWLPYFWWTDKELNILKKCNALTYLSDIYSVSKEKGWGSTKSLTCAAIRAENVASHTTASKWANCVSACLATHWACLVQALVNISTAAHWSNAALEAWRKKLNAEFIDLGWLKWNINEIKPYIEE
jgi:hypothetical protein